MLSAWHLWVVIAIVLLIVEVFTPGFLMASFGIRCLGAALAAGCGFGLKMQVFGFIVGTLIAFFGVRPLFLRFGYQASAAVRTNVEALTGKEGRVTETIQPETGSGRVRVGGDDWRAVTLDGGIVEAGARVVVVRVEGATVVVKPV
jgi:membrane protein implicated in regulation of membrane protease activity